MIFLAAEELSRRSVAGSGFSRTSLIGMRPIGETAGESSSISTSIGGAELVFFKKCFFF
jgi:hypothetical protein